MAARRRHKLTNSSNGSDKGMGGSRHDLSLITHSVTQQVAHGLAARPEHQRKMRLILKIAAGGATESSLCERSGISRTLLRYWFNLSKKGKSPDPFDVKQLDGTTERFHVAFEDAWKTGIDLIEETGRQMATGKYRKVLEYQGQISYLYEDVEDFDFNSGATTMRKRLKLDANGDPIPATVNWADPEMIRFFLKTTRRELFGPVQQIDVHHKHDAVLVIGAPKTSKQLEETYKDIRHDNVQDVEFTEVSDEASDGSTPGSPK